MIPKALRETYTATREKELRELQLDVLKAQGLKVTMNEFVTVTRAPNGTWERLKEIEELDELEELAA